MPRSNLGSTRSSKKARRTRFTARRSTIERLETRCVLSTVQGVVFNDANANALQDVGEAGLSGWTVFLDANEDSIQGAGETAATTDVDGRYALEVPPLAGEFDEHSIGAVLQVGDSTGRWINTTRNLHGINKAALDGGDQLDFGFQFVPYTTLFPLGGETLVNQTTTGQQGIVRDEEISDNSAISADANGNYVVAWTSLGANLQDQVFIRVFNADGTPRGNEIKIAEYTRSAAFLVKTALVAMSADGSRIAVAWDQYNTSTSTLMPWTQLCDGSGTKIGSAKVVSAYKTGERYVASGIAMDANGDYAVLLSGGTQQRVNHNPGITQFQRFTNAGAFAGKRTQVVDAALGNGGEAIAMDAAGNFVVVWQDYDIYAQRYSPTGGAIGGRITVVSGGIQPYSSFRNPSVAMNASGRFVVTWTGDVHDYLNSKVWAQVFDAAGNPAGAKVGVANEFYALPVAVVMDATGDITIAWAQTEGRYAGSAGEIRLRQLRSDGSLSEMLIVNTTTEGHQTHPSLAITKDGFTVAWSGRGEGDDLGVFTQRYTTTQPVAASAETSDAALMEWFFASEEESLRRKKVFA